MASLGEILQNLAKGEVCIFFLNYVSDSVIFFKTGILLLLLSSTATYLEVSMWKKVFRPRG